MPSLFSTRTLSGLDVFQVGDNTTPFADSSVIPSYDDLKTTSQELRLPGLAFERRLDWLVGAYTRRTT